MARTSLTPTILTADSGATNLTTSGTAGGTITTGAGNGVSFSNLPGQTLLLVTSGTGVPGTATVTIGQTVLGQGISSFPVAMATASNVYTIGPFHSVLDAPGSATVSVDFSVTGSGWSAGLIQIPGVY